MVGHQKLLKIIWHNRKPFQMYQQKQQFYVPVLLKEGTAEAPVAIIFKLRRGSNDDPIPNISGIIEIHVSRV